MSNITGKELTRFGTDCMTEAGWTELWNSNSHRPLPRGMVGISDKGYCKGKMLLFIEEKGRGDSMRVDQIQFAEDINGMQILGVQYLVAETKEDYLHYSLIGEQNGTTTK